jgi:hypothetical protein
MPPGFPEPPAWGFPDEPALLLKLREMAELPEFREKEPEQAAMWMDYLRSLELAVLGPGDPRVWAAASRAALAAARHAERRRHRDRRPQVFRADIGGTARAAAALAAGAAAGLAAVPACAADGRLEKTLARERLFAAEALAHCRRLLARSGLEAPPPASGLARALFPGPESRGAGPAPPAPASLRAELAALAPGTREWLAARSRLGEALAHEDAWREARGPAGDTGSAGGAPAPGADEPAGDAGGRSPEAARLLRSSSEGLDGLLGRDHPDSLDARGRLACFLAGWSGPGIPIFPLPRELPPEGDVREAAAMFLETMAHRAAASAGKGGDAAPDAARARSWAAASRGRGEAGPPPAPSPGTLELLADSGDEAAFGAAAAAFAAALAVPVRRGPDPAGCLALARAARDRLGELSPARSRLSLIASVHLLRSVLGGGRPPEADEWDTAVSLANGAAANMQSSLGPSSPEAVAAFANLSLFYSAAGDSLMAACCLADILDALEAPEVPETPPAPGRAGRGGPPPARAPLPPGRAGRDRLAAMERMAGLFRECGDPESVLGVLAPFLDALPDPPPGGDERARDSLAAWPWPPELAWKALSEAGVAAAELGDGALAERHLRRAIGVLDALDALYALDNPDGIGLDTTAATLLRRALECLSLILAGRGDPGSGREAAGLMERCAEITFMLEGPDSSDALASLSGAAGCHESAGDRDRALELHRTVLDARVRLDGAYGKTARESRAHVRRLEREIREG